MRLPLSLFILSLSSLPAISCPSWDTNCINSQNSYRYQQQTIQQQQQWQQQNQNWLQSNDQISRDNYYRSQPNTYGSSYGNRQGSPYRPF